MIKTAVFAAVSAVLIYISRDSLRAPRSHGFYRFFAWEIVFGMFLLNLEGWFREPLSPHQIISWFLLTVSLVPLAFGVYSLAAGGKPSAARRDDTPLLPFEKTTALVTTGIYRYIRHPLYGSLLLLAWGLFFKSPKWGDALLVLAATIFLLATARADEAECIRFFGLQYREYMKRTKMFVPFLI